MTPAMNGARASRLAEMSRLYGMSSLSFRVAAPTSVLMRAVRPLACSIAIHLGLGMIVVAAGSAGLAAPPSARVVWLDLEPADILPPAIPAPPAVVSRQRPLPAPAVAARKPVPVPVLDEPVVPPTPPAAPAREVTTSEPPPTPSLTSPPAPSVTASSSIPEPDRSAASSGAAAPDPRAPIDARASREPQERGTEGPGKSAVASRTPDAAPGGPIVRAARPRGGYQVRPVYPESARRAGIQGTTLLRIHIETDGRVSDVNVERSAGHQSLDQAAADAVRRWRFEPALSSAGPVSMWALVPVEFRIGDRD